MFKFPLSSSFHIYRIVPILHETISTSTVELVINSIVCTISNKIKLAWILKQPNEMFGVQCSMFKLRSAKRINYRIKFATNCKLLQTADILILLRADMKSPYLKCNKMLIYLLFWWRLNIQHRRLKRWMAQPIKSVLVPLSIGFFLFCFTIVMFVAHFIFTIEFMVNMWYSYYICLPASSFGTYDVRPR